MQKKLIVFFAFAIFVLVVGLQTDSYAGHKPNHNPGGGGGAPPPQQYRVIINPNDGDAVELMAKYNGTKSNPTSADGDPFPTDPFVEFLIIDGMIPDEDNPDVSIADQYNLFAFDDPKCAANGSPLPQVPVYPDGITSTDWEINVSPENIMWIGLIFDSVVDGRSYFLRLLGELSQTSLPPPGGGIYMAPITDWKIFLMGTNGRTRCNYGDADSPLENDIGTISVENVT